MKTLYSLSILLMVSLIGHAETYRLVSVAAPPLSRFFVNENEIASKVAGKKYYLYFPDHLVYPFQLKVTGPMGGFVIYDIRTANDLNAVNPGSNIILDKNSRPPRLSTLPKLCPRLALSFTNNQYMAVYKAQEDILNHVPAIQLVDQDVLEGRQFSTGSDMDGKNVLLLKNVKITYDYEDSKIIDSIGTHPLTGKTQVINEGEGGFYANIHYAIIPYNKEVLNYEKQLLLHMAEGTLNDINKNEYRPELRTHSFIPGPFLSKENNFYSMCEWGDTAFQAPTQELAYSSMAMWDWDYAVKNKEHVLMIVWEGDEEEWLIKQELIDPFFLTDDLIGIFEIKKEDTVKPLTLVNKRGDFEMTLQTGNL